MSSQYTKHPGELGGKPLKWSLVSCYMDKCFPFKSCTWAGNVQTIIVRNVRNISYVNNFLKNLKGTHVLIRK
jgi:hypothetical protein